jgi:hypothetical protein
MRHVRFLRALTCIHDATGGVMRFGMMLTALGGVLIATMATVYAAGQEITSFRNKKEISVFLEEGGGFKRKEKLPVEKISTKIEAVSPKGYFKVKGPDGFVWIDEIDVQTNQPKKTDAKACSARVGGAKDLHTFSTTGAGEGCK